MLDFDEYCAGKRTPEECWEPFVGRPAIFPLVANWSRLHAMRDYRRITGAAVLVEVDDDYTAWSRGYIREQVKLGVLDWNVGWVEEDIPEFGHPNVCSPHVHRRALAEADAVIISTRHLAEVVTPINPRAFVCRNVVDPADWPTRPPSDDVFRVMFAASPNMQDLALIRPAMEYAAKQEGVEAIVVGYKPKWKEVREIGWVNDLREYRATMAELRPDLWLRPIETTQFAKSKSDLKILEAAMVGALPVVTPFEPYMGWRDTPVRYAATQKDWQQEIRKAIRDPGRVKEDAAAVREIVSTSRVVGSARPEWTKAIQAATARRSLLVPPAQ